MRNRYSGLPDEVGQADDEQRAAKADPDRKEDRKSFPNEYEPIRWYEEYLA